MAAAEQIALAFVLNATWQAPLVIGTGALLARATRRAPTRVRHQIWTVVLLVAVLAPALGASGLGRALRPILAAPAATRASTAMNAPAVAIAAGVGAVTPAAGASAGDSGLGALWDRAADLQESAARRAPIGRVALLLLVIPALLGGVRLGRSLLRARALRRSACPPPAGDRVVGLADSAREPLGLGSVSLLVTDAPMAPAAIGLLRPAILLPRSLLRDARATELRAVLAHEMAHVARYDAARHVLAEIALLPLRFHPVVPILRRRLAETREMACDEAAAGVVAGGAHAYARALLDVSAILAGLSRPLTLPGVLGAGLLEVRMRHLTENQTPWGRMRARLSLALATIALLALAATAIPFAMGGTDVPPAAPEAPPAPAAPDAQPAPRPPAGRPAPAPPAPQPPHAAPAQPAPPIEPAPAAPPAPRGGSSLAAPPAPPAPPAPAALASTPAPPAPSGTPVPAEGTPSPAPPAAPKSHAARSASDPARFAGTWRGAYDEGDGKGLPGVTLTVTIVDGEPRAAVIMHRHLKNDDGTFTSTAVGLPIIDQGCDDGALLITTRHDHFRFKGGPPRSVDLEWRLEPTGTDTAELAVEWNSYFASARERGEPVPPPPPPMKMSRDR
jgi:beta-lactamase regulating signal transducer with metallopeptidase domain